MALPEDELKKKKNYNSPDNTWPNNQPGSNIYGARQAAPAPNPVAADPQAAADRAAVGGLWEGVKGFNAKAGAAIADVASLPVRIPVAAYDNTVVRGMRAAGLNATPLSPLMVPPGADPGSFTPFQDLLRQKGQSAHPLSAAAQQAKAAAPINFTSDNTPLPTAQTGTQQSPADPSPVPLSQSGITRVGNSYSAAGPVTGDVTINGQPPRNGGAISEQNEGAASGLARQQLGESLARLGTAPQAAGFQPQQFQQSQWASDLARKNAETQASSIHAPTAALGRANVAMLQGERAGALAADATAQRTAMQESGALARSGNQEQGANFRAGLAAQGVQDANTLRRDEFNRSGVAEGFKVDAMKQLQAAQMALTNAKTPEERKAASDTLLALQGRDRPNRFTVVPGGQDTGEDGRPINRPSSVLDNQTGQFVQSPAGQKQASTAPLQNHISALRSDPKLAAQFDEQYGAGASAKILGVK